MSTQMVSLRITLEGEAPGLPAHRLSIGSLALPLNQLLKALRRIASDIVRDSGQFASTLGPYAKEARAIDLQIESLGPGCVELNLVGSMERIGEHQPTLFSEDVLVRAASGLLDAIKAEGSGEERNRTVRSFLQMLPSGIRRQDYRLLHDGKLVNNFTLSRMSLPEVPLAPPFLDIVSGTVSGVSFDPGPSEVWLRIDSGAILRCAAKARMVNEALQFRSIPVEALLLRGTEKARLLWLKKPGDRSLPDHEKKMKHIFNRWSNVLERLAQ